MATNRRCVTSCDHILHPAHLYISSCVPMTVITVAVVVSVSLRNRNSSIKMSDRAAHTSATCRSDKAGATLSSRAAAAETYRVLPPSEKAYTDYDYDIIGEIIQHATERAAKAVNARGQHRSMGKPCIQIVPCCFACPEPALRRHEAVNSSITQHTHIQACETSACCSLLAAGQQPLPLDRLLKSYESVLLHHSVVPEQDFHYYRVLLKLFLDPNPDWWAKLYNERMSNR